MNTLPVRAWTQMAALCVLLISIAGCVSTKAIMLNPSAEPYPPVQPEEVRIYTSEDELADVEFERIAYIEATGSGEWTSQAGMIEAIRKKAAKIGGNGVILPEINEPGAGAKIAGALFGTGTERKGNAIVLRVLGKNKDTSESDAD